MTHDNSEQERLLAENQTWDLVIIGGGITGAGVLREAAGKVSVPFWWSSRILPGARPAARPRWSTAGCAIWPAAISASPVMR